MKYTVLDLEEKIYDVSKMMLSLYEKDDISEHDYNMLMKYIESMNLYIQKNIG